MAAETVSSQHDVIKMLHLIVILGVCVGSLPSRAGHLIVMVYACQRRNWTDDLSISCQPAAGSSSDLNANAAASIMISSRTRDTSGCDVYTNVFVKIFL